MRALYGTLVGTTLGNANVQIYGWVNVGGNVGTAKTATAETRRWHTPTRPVIFHF